MAQSLVPNKPVADIKKHVNDLSQRHVFSAKVGQLLPILSLETIPNADYEIDVQDLLRTNALNQPAYIRGKQNVDFFFVPYSQLFTRFGQFVNQREDPLIAGHRMAKFLPNFSLFDLIVSVASTPEDQENFQDLFGFPYKYNVKRMLDLYDFGWCPLDKPMVKTEGGKPYNYIDDSWLWFFHQYFGTADVYWWIYDQSTGELNPNWLTALTNAANDPVYRKRYNVFRPAAYNKIWNDFYRNPYRDQPLSPDYFNFDDIQCDTEDNSRIDRYREWTGFTDIFNMRYRRWKNDIFTCSYPTPQFGAASTVPIAMDVVDYIALNNPHAVVKNGNVNYDGKIYQNSSGASTRLQQISEGSNSFSGDVVSIFSNNISFGDDSLGFTVAQLRQAIAMQHWAENVIRAGNRTPDNQRAHFGVAPRFESDMHVKFLGSYDGNINLNIVSTSGAAVGVDGKAKDAGSLSANGISLLNGNRINYHSSDFGIIMAIFSILPEAEYNNIMVAKANKKIEPFDFPTPEFQNIGFQPITRGDITMFGKNDITPVGYVPPYWEYKTALDKVHGEFMNFMSNSDTGTPPLPGAFFKGSKADFVSPRWQMQLLTLTDVKVLYVNPRLYDTIFGVAADGKENSDQFNVNMFFDIKVRLPLSVLGLPQY